MTHLDLKGEIAGIFSTIEILLNITDFETAAGFFSNIPFVARIVPVFRAVPFMFRVVINIREFIFEKDGRFLAESEKEVERVGIIIPVPVIVNSFVKIKVIIGVIGPQPDLSAS